MYICFYIELMIISVSLVDVTLMDLWKNKYMRMTMMISISNRKFNEKD